MGVFGETIDVSSPFFKRLTDDKRILTQAIILRLSTRRGVYWASPDYGLDLTEYVNEHLTEDKLVALSTDIKSEIEKDERIATATVNLTMTGGLGSVAIIAEIGIEAADGESFSLTLSVNDLTVELLTRGVA